MPIATDGMPKALDYHDTCFHAPRSRKVLLLASLAVRGHSIEGEKATLIPKSVKPLATELQRHVLFAGLWFTWKRISWLASAVRWHGSAFRQRALPGRGLPGPREHNARAQPSKPADPRRFLGQHVRNFDDHRASGPAATSPRQRPGSRHGSKEAQDAHGEFFHPGITELDAQLLHAVRHGDAEAAERALQAGAAPDCRTLRGQTPLMLAATASHDGSLQLATMLLEARAQVDALDEKRQTPLMHACGSHNIATVDHLLEAKASLHCRAADGKTILMQAFVGTEDMKLVRHLVHRHAAVDAVDNSGWSLLFYACDPLHLELIRWLYTRFGVDLEAPAPDGTTPAELLRRQGLGQPHRWLGRRRRSDMDYLLIDLGLQAPDEGEGSHSPPTSARRGPESSEPLAPGRRYSKRQSVQGPRLSVHSKDSHSSGQSRRRGSKGEGTDSTELPLSLPAEAHGSSRRGSKGPKSEQGPRLSVLSKDSHSSGQSRRRGSKGEGTDSTELPLSLPAEARRSSRRGSKGDSSETAVLSHTLPAEDLEDCSAVVTMHVAANGEQFRDVFIRDPPNKNAPGIHNEQELMNRIADLGYDVV
ncbi:unnamed protein product [Symbiodinium natans]|uniref:Uncharacterized protein n=1 Tax=Symbiodinium natans TaxID=878477 RepID=A0A812IIA5_9DINO|nr:unnamed protein product [Symbiodinium natans]